MTTAEADPVSVEVVGTTLRATDIGGNSLSFELTGWDRLSAPHGFDEPIDVAVTGRLSEIGYDLRNTVGIDRLDGGSIDDADGERSTWAHCTITASDETTVGLEPGEYFLRFDAALFVRLRFDGVATVRHRPGDRLTVSFPQPTTVTFGFKSPVDYPRHELTVEPTTAGVAVGVSHLASSIETTSADRVHRNYRGYPPLLTVGDDTRIPDAVAAATPETGIELLVPDRLAALFSAAPLAYYLGARVRPADVSAPVLRAPSVGLSHEFDGATPFETAAPALLRRVFFLEQMTSWNDPETPITREFDRLAAAGVDVERCVDEPIASRLATYLSISSETVDDVLPPWPYVMAVEPSVSNVSALPHLLYDMAAITPTSDAAVEAPTDERRPSGPAPTTAAAELRRNRGIRGVLGTVDGVSGFTAVRSAYENRLARLGRDAEDPVVVVCGPEAGVDGRTIADRYARRLEDAPVPVRCLDDPTVEAFTAAVADGVAYLHYVGRCENGGLACRGGTLRPGELREPNVGLFQLDAPRSRSVGLDLVEAGAIAGVTRPGEPSVDAASTTIGELVLYGHCLASAHACVRGDAADPAAVVGDGTHRFVAKWHNSPVQVLTERDDGSVEITVVPFPVDPVGAHWVQDWSDGKHLNPSAFSYEVRADELDRYVSGNEHPVYHDGRLYWMDEQKQLVYPVS